MAGTRLVGLGLTVVVGTSLVAFAACSSEKPRVAGEFDGGNNNGNDAFVPPRDGAVPLGDATASTEPLGDLTTVDEPDVPCVPSGGTNVQLFPAGGNGGPAVTLLQSLGAKRFATGPDLPGFITFDPAGTNPQLVNIPQGAVQTVLVSEGTTVGSMVAGNGTVSYQRYDAAGAATGNAVTLASNITPIPSAIWTASSTAGTLGVWAHGDTLSVAGVTTAGAAAGAAWTLATGGVSAHVAVATSNDKFMIASSFTQSGGTTAAQLQLATLTGPSGSAVPLTSSTVAIEVKSIVPTSSGYLLVVEGGGDNKVYLVPVNATGQVSGVARRLLGGDAPWALASRGDEVGLVTMSNDLVVNNVYPGPRRPMFRSFDATGKPLGPWVCLDDYIPVAQLQDMAIMTDGNGYSVVYKTKSDATNLIRFDRLGTN